MQGAERPSSSSWSQIRNLIIVIVVLYFATSLVRTTVSLFQLKQLETGLARANDALVQKTDQRRADIVYFRSDSYVEKIARTLLGWGRPNEKLLAPVSSVPEAAATPVPGRSP